jgi:hypothetical protein
MAQQYRHIIPENPSSLCCNHNLFDIHPVGLNETANQAFMPILNSTIVAFVKPFFGRYAGTEGNLKTEIVDVLLMEVPDPRCADSRIAMCLRQAFHSIQQRKVTHMVEESLLDCRSAAEVREAAAKPQTLPAELQQSDRRELDDAVLELIGIGDAQERQQVLERLYFEVTHYYRNIRVVEVQKMEQRRHGGGKDTVSASPLATDAWSELQPDLRKSIPDWLAGTVTHGKLVEIPEGQVRLPEAGNFFEATTVYFGQKPAINRVCDSRSEAELLAAIAAIGVRAHVVLPDSEGESEHVLKTLNQRLEEGKTKIEQLAAERAGTDKLRERVVALLWHWFTQGFPKSDSDF